MGEIDANAGLRVLAVSSDGRFRTGHDGVSAIMATADGKVEFIAFRTHTLALVTSALGYPAYYPVHAVTVERPVTAVLMDLDGTTVHSEPFWVWIIEQTTASLLDNPRFELADDDLPYVSGHSVSEHLAYCLRTYCPDKTIEQARQHYFEHSRRELEAILRGHGRRDAFQPAPGVKEFLLALKARGIRIGLVTSGLYEKAYPEIVAAFEQLGLGDPRDFYDAIISAGFPLRAGVPGTLGELSSKPHPWLYTEIARVGLGIPFEQRGRVIGVEDSGAGVCAIRLAGFAPLGLAGGTIDASGTRALCSQYFTRFQDLFNYLTQD
jgi:beta-phosphoglucomutase-like phosphatase (HAD superfamily)